MFSLKTENLKKIPSVEELIVLIMSGNVTTVLSAEIIDLIHWILTSPKFKIQSVPREEFDHVLALPKNSKKSSKPKHIFKIAYEGERLKQTAKTFLITNILSLFSDYSSKFFF